MKIQERIKRKINKLKDQYELMNEYLLLKLEEKDYHGVEDAASDIRDIVSAITALEEVLEGR